MTIERSNTSGWGIGEMFTSAQANAGDALHEAAIDKRSGKQDVFMSMLVATGAGRVICTVQTGPDAAATFHVQDGVSLVRVPTLTAARAYTLGHTGATGGDRIIFALHGTGQSPSGYADIKNTSGTGLYRLGRITGTLPSYSAQGERAEFIMGPDGQWALFGNARSHSRNFTIYATTTWTCPPGVYEVLLEGCGGGGGGAGGNKAPASTFGFGTGGGGGGGAVRARHRVQVTPGQTYTITIGAGGSGGSGSGTIPTAGADGGDTTFASSDGTVLARFPGANGGRPGIFVSSSGIGQAGIALGGGPIKTFTASGPTGIAVYSGFAMPLVGARSPGEGGLAVHGFTAISNSLIRAGLQYGIGQNGFTGGSPSTFGADNSHYGGGPGAGGGAGAFGRGGDGGAGGDGASAPGNGVAGSDGTTAAEFTGAGGGGGGAGGGDTTPPNGGSGGDGASGRLEISW